MNRINKSAMVGSVLVLALGTLTAVQAAPPAPEERPFRGKTEIADTTLGDMRGRFISADQILYFGIEMYTEWHTATGESYVAQQTIGIDRSAGARPTVSVTGNVQASGSAQGNGSVGTTSSAQANSGGMDQVKGVGQLVQVSGNGNVVTNAIGVDVVSQRPAASSAAPSANGNTQLLDAQSGATAQTYVTRNSVGVIVSVPTQGTASQSVTSAIGMQQRAQVHGDVNNVHNQLNMVIQVENNSATTAAHMNNMSQTVRGLWQAGIH